MHLRFGVVKAQLGDIGSHHGGRVSRLFQPPEHIGLPGGEPNFSHHDIIDALALLALTDRELGSLGISLHSGQGCVPLLPFGLGFHLVTAK